MKYFLILYGFIFLGCTSNEADDLVCNDLRENPAWKTYQFKNAHTIQFPNNYRGTGIISSIKGNTFFIERNDNKVSFSYFYCNAQGCEDFLYNIGSNLPKEFKVTSQNGEELILNNKIIFCQNGVQEGVFYFNKADISTGRYLMKRGKTFSEAVSISFFKETLGDVQEILRTVSVAECQDDIVCAGNSVSVKVKIQRDNGEIYYPRVLVIKYDKTGEYKEVHQEFDGTSNIVTDSDLGRLKKAGSSLTLEGYDEKSMLLFNEKYVIGHDCCHVIKLSGKDVITIK